jgi:hypothetical protein
MSGILNEKDIPKRQILDAYNLHTYTTSVDDVVEEFEIIFDPKVYELKTFQSPLSNNVYIKLIRL